MVLTAILAAAVVGPSAADFFPLEKGLKKTYEEKSVNHSVTIDIVGGEVEVAGTTCTEVLTQQNGKTINSSYYQVTPDTVYLLGYTKENPLSAPMPVLRVGEKKVKWEYLGKTGITKEAEPVFVSGESELKGTRDVLGQKRAVLEVRLNATMGIAAAPENIEQRATYAQGIGLVELVSKTKIGKRSVESTLRLVKVERSGG